MQLQAGFDDRTVTLGTKIVRNLTSGTVSPVTFEAQGLNGSPPGSSPYAGELFSVDFNGDGNLDVARSNYNGTDIYFGNGNGTFGAVTFYAGIGVQAVADLNHDGYLDLIGSDGGRLNDGSGGFATTFSFNGGVNGTAVTADFDGSVPAC